MTNTILQSLGLDLVNINVSAKFYQDIPNGSRAMEFFRKLIGDTQFHKLSRGLGIALTDDKCHFAIPLARFCQYQCVRKILSNYSKSFNSYGHFSQIDQKRDTQGDYRAHVTICGWLGRAMVLGSFQCRGVLLLSHMVGQGPAVLAAGAGRVFFFFFFFFFSSRLSYLPFLMPHL